MEFDKYPGNDQYKRQLLEKIMAIATRPLYPKNNSPEDPSAQDPDPAGCIKPTPPRPVRRSGRG